MKKSRKRRLSLRQLIHIDIGTVIFFIILIYLLFSIMVYLTSRKTAVYEVRMGTLSENAAYRGIALRQELVIGSRYTGNINYYNKEGERVRTGGLVYTVDETRDIQDYADTGMSTGKYFTADDQASFREQSIRFTEDYDPGRFYSVYAFKTAASSQAQKISNHSILAGVSKKKAAGLHSVSAKDTGVIVYSYDNYVGKTFDSLSLRDFNRSSCKTAQLRNGDAVKKDRPAYRIVTDENWSIAIAVDSKETAERLQNQEYVEVRFLKNGYSTWASVTSRSDEEGNWFVNLSLSNSMEAFCMDRFVDIVVLTNEEKGLKVPVSSITYGDFFLVPKEYVIEGSNGQPGVLLRVYTANGSQGTQFIPAVPYSETNKEYYLDNSVLRDGEILEKPNSSDQFTLHRKEKLIGVYYINKGYPDFRQVTVNLQNSEYAIIKPNELYGLQEYDYIVLHADSIRLTSYGK